MTCFSFFFCTLTECVASSPDGDNNSGVGNDEVDNNGSGNHTESNTIKDNQHVPTSTTTTTNSSNMSQNTLSTTARGCTGEGYFADYPWSSDLATFTALPLTSLATIGEGR